MPAADTTITANWRHIGGGGSTTDYYRLTFETNGGSEIASSDAEYTTIDLTDYTDRGATSLAGMQMRI